MSSSNHYTRWLWLVAGLAVASIFSQQQSMKFRKLQIPKEYEEEDPSEASIVSSTRSASSSSASSTPSSPWCHVVPDDVPRYKFHPKPFFEEGDEWLRSYLPTLRHFANLSRTAKRPPLRTRFRSFQVGNSANRTCHATFYHLHKNGGTTMSRIRQPRFQMKDYNAVKQIRIGRDEFYNASQAIMTDLYERQQNHNDDDNDHVVFTFVRDPVSRFVSGVSQIFLNKRAGDDLSPCPETSNTTQELFTCVLTMMENKGHQIDNRTTATATTASPIFVPDAHIAPQAFGLYQNVMDLDIAVDVMDLSIGLNAMLSHLDIPPIQAQQATGKTNDRFVFDYGQLTPEIVRHICRVYRMDVEMLRQTGVVTESECFNLKDDNDDS